MKSGAAWILLLDGGGQIFHREVLAEASGRDSSIPTLLLQAGWVVPYLTSFKYTARRPSRSRNEHLRSLEPAPVVLATGGGIVLRDENWAELHRLGTTVFLDASIETLKTGWPEVKRRTTVGRGRLGRAAGKPVGQRRALYEQADVVVQVDDVDLDHGRPNGS